MTTTEISATEMQISRKIVENTKNLVLNGLLIKINNVKLTSIIAITQI